MSGKTVVLPFVLASLLCVPGFARAGVLQRVTAIQGNTPLIDPNFPGFSIIPRDLLPGSFSHFDQDEIFGATSTDINTDILAQIGGVAGAGFFHATSAAGRFGNVGLSTSMLQELGEGLVSGTRVLIASDEVFNPFGTPRTAIAHFVVDGGKLAVDFGREVQADYRLVVGAVNLGNVPMTATPDELANLLFFGDYPPFLGQPGNPGNPTPTNPIAFGSQGSLRADSSGTVQYFTYPVEGATVNSDIGAVIDPTLKRVDIPLSFQSVNFGTLQPGDRLLLFYSLYLETKGLHSFSGGASAQFSDPLNLASNVNFPTVTLQTANAVPEPSMISLFVAGMAILALQRNLSRWRVRKRGDVKATRYSTSINART